VVIVMRFGMRSRHLRPPWRDRSVRLRAVLVTGLIVL
jgi:hypothetical protein